MEKKRKPKTKQDDKTRFSECNYVGGCHEALMRERSSISPVADREAFLSSVGGLAAWRKDVVTVFVLVVTRGPVVADSEGNAATINVSKCVANLGGAGDVSSAFPDDLGEVSPLIKEIHGWVGFTVTGVVTNLVVVHQVGNHLTNFSPGDAIADVLAVRASDFHILFTRRN